MNCAKCGVYIINDEGYEHMMSLEGVEIVVCTKCYNEGLKR